MASATANLPPTVQDPVSTVIDNGTLNQFLQSDHVQKLFNQPNIVIHAIPHNDSPTAYRMVKSGTSIELTTHERSDQSDLPSNNKKISNGVDKHKETFLPSKKNGKSEIVLVPIVRKRKECGHFEPCESLTCDVVYQQYEDEKGLTPLISTSLKEEEIDEEVSKQCECQKYDPLSSNDDHSQSASTELYKCNKCTTCDICGMKFDNLVDHLNHKKCKRKSDFLHNIATPTEVFKYKMRQRELQILDDAKFKKTSDYLDPVMGFSRTMTALTNNDELIIIPKAPPPHYKLFNSNTSPMNNLINLNNYYGQGRYGSNYCNSFKNNYRSKKLLDADKELTSAMITSIIESCQKSIESRPKRDKTNYLSLRYKSEKPHYLSSKHIKLSDHLNGGTVEIKDLTNAQFNYPIDANMLVQKSNTYPKKNTKTNIQDKNNLNSLDQQPVLTSLGLTPTNQKAPESSQILKKESKNSEKKVKAFTNLASTDENNSQTSEYKLEVTLQNENEKPMITPLLKSPNENKKFKAIANKNQLASKHLVNILPKPSDKIASEEICSKLEVSSQKEVIELFKKQKFKKRSRKKLLKKGKFKCTHCQKGFSSIEYCKLHIARHENNTAFFCRICEKGFVDKYEMKKHSEVSHKIGEVKCEMCNSIVSSVEELNKHMKNPSTKLEHKCLECSECFDTCRGLDYHMRKIHGFLICAICKHQIAKLKIKRHLMLEHSISKNRVESNLNKLSLEPEKNDSASLENSINEVDLQPIEKIQFPKENKTNDDCLARSRTSRRKLSKEMFLCTVCDRRFENEKQFQIHLANNPMKFTTCSKCSKKFHRKAECNEHNKTCGTNVIIPVKQAVKRKISKYLNENLNLKNGKFSTVATNSTEVNSADQNQNTALKHEKCDQLEVVKMEDVAKNIEKSKDIAKNSIKTKALNGVKEDLNSSEFVKVTENENVWELNVNLSEANFIESSCKLMQSILHDHDYLETH
ncbi:hypothetical protein TKK_0001545 [Trichogramma kaykai]|uniref:C2H2-type domain-containing protein n=1 Tax=Trichogramma kaykai TaxID=54128 RepID=A0ABD2X0U8_9HYME